MLEAGIFSGELQYFFLDQIRVGHVFKNERDNL